MTEKPNEMKRRICQALGLDPFNIRALSIDMDSGSEWTRVTVEYQLTKTGDIADVVGQYELRPQTRARAER